MSFSPRVAGYIEAVLSASFFGLIPFWYMPLYKKGLSPESSLFYRFLFAFLIMLTLCMVRKKSIKISAITFFHIFIASVGCFLCALCLFLAITHIPSGVASTIFFINPIFVMLVMVMFYKEPLEGYKIILSLFTFLGVALLSGFFNSLETVNTTGVVLSLCSGLTYTIYIIGIFKVQHSQISKDTLSIYIFLISGMLTFLYTLGTDTFVVPKDAYTVMQLIFGSLITAVLPSILLISAIKKVGSVISSILGAMEPITAVIVGVVVFYEKLSLEMCFGILIIVFSVVLLTITPMLRQKKLSKNN